MENIVYGNSLGSVLAGLKELSKRLHEDVDYLERETSSGPDALKEKLSSLSDLSVSADTAVIALTRVYLKLLDTVDATWDEEEMSNISDEEA